jgi:hypothetical protein
MPWALRDTHWFDTLLNEDGPYEWLTVVGCAVALVLFARTARRTDHGLYWLGLGGAAALMFFVIGEELAWGTHLLHHGVGAIESVNHQGDTTLHNIGEGLEASFIGIATTSAFAIGWFALVRRAHVLVATWFALPLLYALLRLGVTADHVLAKWGESFELLYAIGAARLAYLELTSESRDRVGDGVGRLKVQEVPVAIEDL